MGTVCKCNSGRITVITFIYTCKLNIRFIPPTADFIQPRIKRRDKITFDLFIRKGKKGYERGEMASIQRRFTFLYYLS